MSTKERKSFLFDVVTKFKELKGWCSGLTDESDKKYLCSQGLSSFEVSLVVWVFLPLAWAISTSFAGVPFFVSFLKRRLKRTSAKAKSDRKVSRSIGSVKSKELRVSMKCCKGCEVNTVKKLAAKAVHAESSKYTEGKGLYTKKNFLKRLKKRKAKIIKRELIEKAPKSLPMFVSDGIQAVPVGLIQKQVKVEVLGQRLYGQLKVKRAARRHRRFQEISSGIRQLPLEVLAARCKASKGGNFFPLLITQFKSYFRPGPGSFLAFTIDSMFDPPDRTADAIELFGVEVLYALLAKLRLEDREWTLVANNIARLVTDLNNRLRRESLSSSSSTSRKPSSHSNSNTGSRRLNSGNDDPRLR